MSSHKILVYERAFLTLGALLLVVCLAALFYASITMGIHLPDKERKIDPAAITSEAPFDNPGVRQTGPGTYEVVMIAQIWLFNPNVIRVPVGSEVTFIATSRDVLHGMHVEGTNVNMMLIPGQISRNTYRFEEPGERLILCHEYCGGGHHTMFATMIVE